MAVIDILHDDNYLLLDYNHHDFWKAGKFGYARHETQRLFPIDFTTSFGAIRKLDMTRY